MSKKILEKLKQGAATKIFPNAELLVAQKGTVIFHENVGIFFDHQKFFFDLASLTKPLCTAFLTMIFVQEHKINLDDTVAKYFPTKILSNTAITELLNHTSGLVAWKPFYETPFPAVIPVRLGGGIQNPLKTILQDPSCFRTAGPTIYSDLGYILLGAILQKVGGQKLHHLFAEFISKKLKLENQVFFIPLDQKNTWDKNLFLPTQDCPIRKKTIQGEVMDLNAWVMGGVSGHAGLFANASAIHKILCAWREASLDMSLLLEKNIFETFCRPFPNRNPREKYFTLGFDTPTRGQSQSGNFFSKNSIGHLGYSGTSFWWDLDKDFWIIFLTNRHYKQKNLAAFKKFRPELHDIIIEDSFT